MGVWQRSPVGREISLETYPELRAEDVIGSPYCVRDYVVDERFGGPDALAHARSELARRGVKLILDYVPNHVAPDHPWVAEQPGCFIYGPDGVIANGRDPYFPPWTDVVQLNAFSPELREAVAELLVGIAAQCDGVRCDMAMLMVNDVFARTWELPVPAEEFWPPLIDRVKAVHPRLHVHRRGVLGHGVRAPAAGLRLLLRQAALRPAGPRGRGVGARALAGGPCVSGAAAALHREPRRAARGHRTRRAPPSGGGRDVDGPRRAALPRRPVRGPPRAHPGVRRPRAGRAARRGTARVLRPPAPSRARVVAASGGCATPRTRSSSRGPGREHLVVVNLGRHARVGARAGAVDGRRRARGPPVGRALRARRGALGRPRGVGRAPVRIGRRDKPSAHVSSTRPKTVGRPVRESAAP